MLSKIYNKLDPVAVKLVKLKEDFLQRLKIKILNQSFLNSFRTSFRFFWLFNLVSDYQTDYFYAFAVADGVRFHLDYLFFLSYRYWNFIYLILSRRKIYCKISCCTAFKLGDHLIFRHFKK